MPEQQEAKSTWQIAVIDGNYAAIEIFENGNKFTHAGFPTRTDAEKFIDAQLDY